MMELVWVVDTSALIQIKSFVPRELRTAVFDSLELMVDAGRLVFPAQVVKELKRDSGQRSEDQPCTWASKVEGTACALAPSLDDVRDVLAVVPDILDHMKDSGEEEADPFVIALALKLRNSDRDARVVVQELRDTPRKLSLNTACGMLGIPSVPLLGLLRAEGITYRA